MISKRALESTTDWRLEERLELVLYASESPWKDHKVSYDAGEPTQNEPPLLFDPYSTLICQKSIKGQIRVE